MKHNLSALTLLIVFFCCHANAKQLPQFPTVKMQNATNCHIKSDGSHYVGIGLSSFYTYVEPNLPLIKKIGPLGSWGDVAVINNEAVILGQEDSHARILPYALGDKYIISDDRHSCYLGGVPGCFKLSQSNPCK